MSSTQITPESVKRDDGNELAEQKGTDQALGSISEELVQFGSVALPGQLGWLRDAPLFIDNKSVEAIHDAVVRPTFHDGNVVLNLSEQQQELVAKKVGASGKVDIKSWFARFSIGATADRTTTKGTTDVKGEQVTLHPIRTPLRQLEQLAITYSIEYINRVEFISEPAHKNWREDAWIKNTPRALVFLDLPKGVKIIPTAAEFANNKIVTLFDKLLAPNGERPPKYPEEAESSEALSRGRKEYWDWYARNFKPKAAMELVERIASENSRINWIDFRLPVTDDGETLHLHFNPAGGYDTGVFAYNLIKRGYEHGLRIVGTMKSDPSMNVLAVFDK